MPGRSPSLESITSYADVESAAGAVKSGSLGLVITVYMEGDWSSGELRSTLRAAGTGDASKIISALLALACDSRLQPNHDNSAGEKRAKDGPADRDDQPPRNTQPMAYFVVKVVHIDYPDAVRDP